MGGFWKFFLLGGFSTAIDYIVFSIALWFGLDYTVAITMGYSVGLWANFILGRRYVFTGGARITQTHRELLGVVAIAIVGLLLNIAIVKLLSYEWFEFDIMLSRIIAIGFVFFWNYFMRKLFIYH